MLDGSVRFVTDSINTGNLALGLVKSGNSNYGVWGAMGSDYRVSVTKIDRPSDASLPGSQGSPTNPEAYAAQFEVSKKKTSTGPKYLLPEKYSSFDKSELTVSVSEGGSGQEAITLAD